MWAITSPEPAPGHRTDDLVPTSSFGLQTTSRFVNANRSQMDFLVANQMNELATTLVAAGVSPVAEPGVSPGGLRSTSRIRTGSAGIPAGELQFWPKTAEKSNTPAGMPALPVGGVANPRTPVRRQFLGPSDNVARTGRRDACRYIGASSFLREAQLSGLLCGWNSAESVRFAGVGPQVHVRFEGAAEIELSSADIHNRISV